ncbi:MAG TPA: hypothetical protein PKC22_13680 [Rhodocyclaceae bacterium]|nr:hypothetical protein [Rhodocyclaceae bacterium]
MQSPLKLYSNISPGGDSVRVVISRGGRELRQLLSFGEASNLYHEVRFATRVMTDRQRMTLRKGEDALEDIIRTAIRPDSICFTFDRMSGEVLVIYQFHEHAPFCVRMSQEQLGTAMESLQRTMDRARN